MLVQYMNNMFLMFKAKESLDVKFYFSLYSQFTYLGKCVVFVKERHDLNESNNTLKVQDTKKYHIVFRF